MKVIDMYIHLKLLNNYRNAISVKYYDKINAFLDFGW